MKNNLKCPRKFLKYAFIDIGIYVINPKQYELILVY